MGIIKLSVPASDIINISPKVTCSLHGVAEKPIANSLYGAFDTLKLVLFI